MRILVTGASGSIGCRLVERLASEHGPRQVVALVGPGADAREASRLPRLRASGARLVTADLLAPLPGLGEADVVFHCAANLRTELRSESEDPSVRVNDLGTERLLDALGESLRGKVFVLASSVAVTDRWGKDGPPRTLYGRTKLRSEEIVAERARRQGFRAVILRIGTAYGPDVRAGHVFEIVTRHVKEGTWAGRVRWPGRVSLVHTDDTVEIMARAASDVSLDARPRFAASPEDVTVAEWMDSIADALGRPRPTIVPPAWLLALVRAACNLRPLWRVLPSRLAWLAWRGSLIIGDGFRCDGSELGRLLPRGYRPYREGVARSFAPADSGERVCA
ncbi:MAG: NAD-dependent epimerase/dehydratase family protein [Elusimicrobia bacterium]|nr:NAD-dependent epimerase/dehydratase family protein [Elusimicrobiota bacterium]